MDAICTKRQKKCNLLVSVPRPQIALFFPDSVMFFFPFSLVIGTDMIDPSQDQFLLTVVRFIGEGVLCMLHF